jgi:two-component system OmpR family sensor kinase
VRSRLFWKILVTSWVIFILIAVSNELLFLAAIPAVVPWGAEVVNRFGHIELAAAAQILETQGPAGVVDFLARLPPRSGQVEVIPGDAPISSMGKDLGTFSQVVHASSGTFTLVYRTSPGFLPPTPPPLRRMPLHLLEVDFIALLLFSALIARYLSGPIQRLNSGLAQMAKGDLSVRLGDQLGRRRDELADLARDFDRMAERLQQLLESRERLLHDVSHEFRSPLTRLLLALDLARQNPERSLASLDRIEYEAQRLNEMVGELLTMSRAEFNTVKSDTYFAIADLIATIAADARFEAQAKEVALIVELPPDGVGSIIEGSPGLLRRGIENVVRNAVRISKPGQLVTVRLTSSTAPECRLRIEVIDKGPGVPDDSLTRIFEPFVRLERETQGGGFGLGLAIARSAARAHHGDIWAVNNAGGGLTVVMELIAKEITLPPFRSKEDAVS